MKKLFFGLEMKWWKVILFAVVTGVYTGVIMQIHVLDGTSFQDIGISYEAWVLFAIIICMNCEKSIEAALKTFVFFLISQPLVYLTMWPEYHCFPWHYYRFWGILTILTLPGGYICHQVKRKNVLSAVILSVACGLLAVLGCNGLLNIIRCGGVPYGLLTVLFCLGQIIVYIIVLLPHKRERIITAVITAVLAAAFCVHQLNTPLGYSNYPLEESVVSCTAADEKIVTATADGEDIDFVAHRVGSTTVTCTMADGGTVIVQVTVKGDGSITVHSVTEEATN